MKKAFSILMAFVAISCAGNASELGHIMDTSWTWQAWKSDEKR